MDGKNMIRDALKSFMFDGDANACQIYKGWDYDGAVQRYGWYYRPFGGQPVYLGKSLAEAKAAIAEIAESRTED